MKFSMWSSWQWVRLALIAFAILGASSARGDRITYGGETWNDVLIYKSSTMYYVKVPEEGTIFNVPIDAVSPANVEIVLDPYYRDELRERFEQNATQSARTSTDGVGASVFNVSDVGSAEEAAVGAEGAAPAPGGVAPAPGGAAAPAGPDPMAQIKAMLQAQQFSITNEGADLVATSPDGATKVVFIGGTIMGGVDYTSTVPEAMAQSQVMALGLLGGAAGQAAPWAANFMQQEVAPLLQTGGTAEKAEGPLSVKAEVTKQGGNVTVHVAMAPVAPAAGS